MSQENQQKQPDLTPEQQLAFLKKEFVRLSPAVLAVGQVYHKRYPIATTNPEVIDAVTVPLGFRAFSMMTSLCMLLCKDDLIAAAQARQAARVAAAEAQAAAPAGNDSVAGTK